MVSLYRFNAKIQMSFSINTLGYFLNSVIWLGQCLNQYAKNYRVFISIYMYIHFLHLIHLIFLLAHLHLRWKLKWAFLVTFCLLSVCPYTFHFFNIFSKTTNQTNLNQTWHKANLGKQDSRLWKLRSRPLFHGR